MDPQNSTSSGGFFAGNKLLGALLAFFVLLIVFETGYYFFIKKPQSNSKVSETQQSNPKPTPIDIFKEVSPQRPLNQLNYEQVKAQVPSWTKQESRFEGIFLGVKNTLDGIEFELESTLPNSRGQKVWYHYKETSIPKITYLDSSGNPLKVNNLSKGDGVTIDEKNDYSKPYPESIIAVKITKL